MPSGKKRVLKPQDILFYKGDSGDEMYIILKGKVRLTKARWNAGRKDDIIMRDGEFFGEFALVKNSPRTRTAIMEEETVLLCIGKRDWSELVQEQPAMAARILQALDRREKSNRGVGTGSNGSSGGGDDADVLKLRGFDTDSDYLYLKIVTCPVCDARFEAERMRESRLAVLARDPDLRIRYKDIEPLWYRYTVCPKCLYAAKDASFEDELSDEARETIKGAMEDRKKRHGIFDFQNPRDNPLAVTSLRLADQCLAALNAPAAERASVALREMWLLEDAEDKDAARKAMERAADLFVEAHKNSREKPDPKADQRLAYLIALLSYRLHRTQQAVSFVSEAVKLEREGDKGVAEMVRDLHAKVRQRQKQEAEGAAQAQSEAQ